MIAAPPQRRSTETARAALRLAAALAAAFLLKGFAPAQAATGGRVMMARALETIAIAADLKARALPAIDAWIKARK